MRRCSIPDGRTLLAFWFALDPIPGPWQAIRRQWGDAAPPPWGEVGERRRPKAGPAAFARVGGRSWIGIE